MRNIALILMYNGTAYHGWQVQKTERTVAETLEKGLSMVCGEKIKCVGCGRTDAGVHAEYYVANFHTGSRIPVERIPSHGREQSLCIKIPPFGGVFYQGRGRLPLGKRKGAEA